MSKKFSFTEYEYILRRFHGRWKDYSEPLNDNFVLLRHDVEFSVQRALDLATLEYSLKISSTYNFQVISNAYNALSVVNIGKIKKILNMGHKIGLHFYISHIPDNDWTKLREDFDFQLKTLNFYLNIDCDRFSFHRPKKWVLSKRSDKIFDIINQYGPSYFQYADNPNEIKYISDSRHTWDYGYPADFINQKKLHLLFHPDEWTKDGKNEKDNFISLKQEKAKEMSNTFYEETPKNFKKYLNIL